MNTGAIPNVAVAMMTPASAAFSVQPPPISPIGVAHTTQMDHLAQILHGFSAEDLLAVLLKHHTHTHGHHNHHHHNHHHSSATHGGLITSAAHRMTHTTHKHGHATSAAYRTHHSHGAGAGAAHVSVQA